MNAATAAANVASAGEAGTATGEAGTAAGEPGTAAGEADTAAGEPGVPGVPADVLGVLADAGGLPAELRALPAEVRALPAEVRGLPAGGSDLPVGVGDGPADGISRAADPDAPAISPVIPVTAGVPAAEPGAVPDRRGARDRAVRRSAGPSVGLMTRAYVSLIHSHAAPSRFIRIAATRPRPKAGEEVPLPPSRVVVQPNMSAIAKRAHARPSTKSRQACHGRREATGCPACEPTNLQRGQAALIVRSLLTYSGPGRPMISASPHAVQPHSWQSPSGTSGQPPGSA
jgi:hypothetical protein